MALSNNYYEENNYLRIERTHKKLHSRLNKKYEGYSYTIKNKHTEPIELLGVTLWNNATSQVAYLSVKQTTSSALSEAFSSAQKISFPTLGLSYVVTAMTSPIIAFSNKIGNSNAQKESQKYDLKFAKPLFIDSNKTITVKTMALLGYKPIFKIVYRNPITDDNMSLELK